MSDELKACGGCGRNEASIGVFDDWDVTWWVECGECGACTGRHNTRTEAIAAWNRRTVTREQVALMLGATPLSGLGAVEINHVLKAAGFEVEE